MRSGTQGQVGGSAVTELRHNHEVLVEVLVYHQRTNNSGCHCGWGELGHSYAEHVAGIYEDSLRVRCQVDQ